MAIDDVMGPALTIQKGDRAGGRAVILRQQEDLVPTAAGTHQ